jgi:Mrp family chromosome partitioning ATPase
MIHTSTKKRQKKGTNMANSRNGSSNPAVDLENTTVHLSLQGKGGVGKSLVASLLAQYFKLRKGISVRCIDADAVNQTLGQYNELGAERLDLMREGSVTGSWKACWLSPARSSWTTALRHSFRFGTICWRTTRWRY